MEVTQAIRKLLFLEDCLIIPGLGGFVSSYHPAVIDRASGTFIPPVKEVVFNPELVQNDGILVRFLATQNGTSYEQARQETDVFTGMVQRKLEKGEPVFIDGIGQFILDRERVIRFQTDPGTNLFLGSYGLSSFHLNQLTSTAQSDTLVQLSPIEEVTSGIIEFDLSGSGRRRRNHNLRRIAIAMPLLIAFSLLPYNSRISDTFSSSKAGLVPEPSLFRLDYPDAIKRDTARLIVYPITAADSVSAGANSDKADNTPVVPEPISPEPVAISEGKYPVIAGCFKVQENAEKLCKQLTDKGYPAVVTPSRNGYYKVSIQSFATRQEAINGLARLKQAEPGMDLWVALQ